MALFAAAARRAATSSLPLLRASVSRGGIALLRPLAAAAARPMPFSSAAGAKPSSDGKLPRVIKSESKLAVNYDDDNMVDEDGDSDWSLSSSDESSPFADDSSSSSVRIQGDQGKNHPKEDSIHTTCISQMNDDSSVKFSCTIYPTERKIVIDALALRPPPSFYEVSDEDDDIIETDGCFTESEEVVEFRKLDVKLQHALYKLVEPMRYYTPEITELFQEHIMSKDRPRLLFWETKLWDFLNKYEPMEQVKPPSFSPFKITDKGLEVMSRDEVLRMASSALKFAANCGDRNRDQDDKKDIENLRRYLTLRQVPKFLQEHIINKL